MGVLEQLVIIKEKQSNIKGEILRQRKILDKLEEMFSEIDDDTLNIIRLRYVVGLDFNDISKCTSLPYHQVQLQTKNMVAKTKKIIINR